MTQLTDEPQPESGPKSSRSPRGAAFPRMTVPEATQALRQVHKAGRHHSPGSMSSLLGHSSPNSGAFRQKLADLREFGLVAGRGEELELTTLALRITRPTSTDDADAAIRESFLHCATFEQMYTQVAKGEPMALEILGNLAIHTLNVGDHVADRFAQCFAEGVVAARLGERDDGNIVLWEREERPAVTAGASSEEPSSGAQDLIAPVGHDEAVALHQTWSLDPGSVQLTIRVSEALPSSSFAPLAEAVTAIESLVTHLRGGRDPAPASDSGEE